MNNRDRSTFLPRGLIRGPWPVVLPEVPSVAHSQMDPTWRSRASYNWSHKLGNYLDYGGQTGAETASCLGILLP